MKNTIVGKFIKNFDDEMAYYSYQPSELSSLKLDSQPYQERLKIAYDNLDVIRDKVKNLNPHYINLLLAFDSYYSCVLDGYQNSFDDVFLNRDQFINNTIYTTLLACDLLETTPLSKRFIKQLHKSLDSEVKYQGEFRTTQNWIGDPDSSLKTARFIPPNVEDMHRLMDDLEKYINYSEDDPLIKMAMVYYQLYVVHPFLKDNEALARVLVQVMMVEYNLLEQPILPLSFFINTTHLKYYFMLNNVRDLNSYEAWINYFLDIINYAIINLNQTIDQLNNLKIDFDCSNIFIKYPIITKAKFKQLTQFNDYQCDKLFKELLNNNILKVHNNSKRYRNYVFDELWKIVNESLL